MQCKNTKSLISLFKVVDSTEHCQKLQLVATLGKIIEYIKNVLQLLNIIAHEIIVPNSVSEYTHGPWKVSDACGLLM